MWSNGSRCDGVTPDRGNERLGGRPPRQPQESPHGAAASAQVSGRSESAWSSQSACQGFSLSITFHSFRPRVLIQVLEPPWRRVPVPWPHEGRPEPLWVGVWRLTMPRTRRVAGTIDAGDVSTSDRTASIPSRHGDGNPCLASGCTHIAGWKCVPPEFNTASGPPASSRSKRAPP